MNQAEAFQDYYDEAVSHCYGCGRLNEAGLKIRSFWEGEVAVCRYMPRPEHLAIPGVVYGGLIASLIDCHSTGTAAAAAYRAEGREMNTYPRNRYVTASLHVNYLRPTPMGIELELRARVVDASERKTTVATEVFAGDLKTAEGRAVLVRMPEHWLDDDAN